MKNKPIGVFDSGVGGLTVVRQLQEHFPNEDIIYFGDTARVPYGTKSHNIIRYFSLQDAKFLADKDVKCIVVACNTASAHAIRDIRQRFSDLPVLGMIESGALYAASKTKTNHVGVIGTPATINSDLYATHLRLQNEKIKVTSKSCPLFVPITEEALSTGTVAHTVISHYLDSFVLKHMDTLILGCTHYPLLKEEIQKFVGSSVYLVDSGKAAAIQLKSILVELDLLTDREIKGELNCFLSCVTPNFEKIASLCLKHEIKSLELIDIESISL